MWRGGWAGVVLGVSVGEWACRSRDRDHGRRDGRRGTARMADEVEAVWRRGTGESVKCVRGGFVGCGAATVPYVNELFVRLGG